MKEIRRVASDKKNISRFFLSILFVLALAGCNKHENLPGKQETIKDRPTEDSMIKEYKEEDEVNSTQSDDMANEKEQVIDKEGNTLETRIKPPSGYQRTEVKEDSITYFLRDFTMKADGSPVLLYNGEKKMNQNAHVAVFDLEVGTKDLQQCADSIIRIYAEYFWKTEAYDKIRFHLTNGFLMEYGKWRDGYRLNVSGNEVTWVKKQEYEESYESFRNYLDTVYMYAGTLSLSEESQTINIEEIEVGDIFIEGGSPGHCVMVSDVAENEEGRRCFLLSQGFMPAQEFHILKNPLYDENPWYYEEELSYPLNTPQWTFGEGSLKRWSGFENNS